MQWGANIELRPLVPNCKDFILTPFLNETIFIASMFTRVPSFEILLEGIPSLDTNFNNGGPSLHHSGLWTWVCYCSFHMKYIHDKASEHVPRFIEEGEFLKGGRGLVIPISKDFSPGAHEVSQKVNSWPHLSWTLW
jgi:hypothetical protein